MSIIDKKQMTEEDIKLNFITPAILAKGWLDKITMETKVKLKRKTFTTILLPLGQKQAVFGRFGQFFRKEYFPAKAPKISSANLPPFCKFLLPFHFRAFLRLHKYL